MGAALETMERDGSARAIRRRYHGHEAGADTQARSRR
jgi:hypothetical protein